MRASSLKAVQPIVAQRGMSAGVMGRMRMVGLESACAGRCWGECSVLPFRGTSEEEFGSGLFYGEFRSC